MLSTRFDDALACASDWHRAQSRKGTQIPYISHLMAVASLAIEYGGDEDAAIAALLHDAIEDAGQTEDTLADRFGPVVAQTVAQCSDFDGKGPRPDWQVRKQAYINSIATKSDRAALVTSCDKLHNATAILEDLRQHGASVFDRFTAPREGTLWYYGELAQALSNRLPGALTTRLARTVDTLSQEAG
jgi:GTP pyrophosphokinase